jgi:hypothetical protein
VIAAALLTLTPAAARADDPPPEVAVRLSYSVSPGIKYCPPEQTLHDEVARRMGFDPFKPGAPDRIVAKLKHSARGLTATVERFDSKDVPQWQPKTWPPAKCSELVQAMGIYISFMLLPPVVPPEAATLTPSPPAASTSAEPPALPKVEPPPPRSPPLHPPLPSPPRRWAGRIAASGGSNLGVAPANVAAVMSLEGGLQWRYTPDWVLSGALGVLYSPRASAPMPVELMSGAHVELGTTLVTSVLAPCLHWRVLSSWVFSCAGLEIGRLSGKVTMNGRSLDGGAPWAAFQPRFGVEVPVASLPLPGSPQLAARIFGDAMVPLPARFRMVEGPSMSSGTITEVWVTSPVTGSLSLGLVTWFDL